METNLVLNSNFFGKTTINFHNNIAYLYGTNNSKKSLLLHEIYEGLKGKEIYKLSFNSSSSCVARYQCVFLKELFDLQNELKLTKSNLLRNCILKKINSHIIMQQDNENFQNRLNTFYNDLEEVINSLEFKEMFDLDEKLSVKFNIDTKAIDSLIDKLLKVYLYKEDESKEVDEKSYSRFTIRMLILEILFLEIDFNDKERPIFLLLDLPDACADDNNILKLSATILEWIGKYNINVIITVNSSFTLKLFNPDLRSINFISNSKIINLKKLKSIFKNIAVCYSFIESKSTDLIIYKQQITSLINNDDLHFEYSYYKKRIEHYLYMTHIFRKIVVIESKDVSNWNADHKALTLNINYKDIVFLFVLSFELELSKKIDWNIENLKLKALIENYFI